VAEYVDAIPVATRPLFDRVRGLIAEVAPDAAESMSYRMPTYRTASGGIHLAAWKHGVSLYGWDEAANAAFLQRHPGLSSGRGTLKITHGAAAAITDDELRDLLRTALVRG
jgi:uncharacterized protein YdhG (YjbR/CyaY superfamily)